MYPVAKIDGADALVIPLDHLKCVLTLDDDLVGESIARLVWLAGALIAIDLLPPLTDTVRRRAKQNLARLQSCRAIATGLVLPVSSPIDACKQRSPCLPRLSASQGCTSLGTQRFALLGRSPR